MATRRIASYDGLKGLSIMAVVAYHLFPNRVPGGFLMVNTFLVVAGFFFARNLEKILATDEGRSWKQLGNYLRKTLIRLFIPLFWLLLLVVVGLFLFNQKELKFIRSDILSALFFVNNFFQIAADRSYFVQMSNASPFTHLWYTSIHLQSVLLASGLMLLLQKLRLSLAAKGIFWLSLVLLSHTLMTIIYDPAADPTRVYYGLDTRFSSFAIGIATAYISPIILNVFYRLENKQLLYNQIALISSVLMAALVFTRSDQASSTYSLWMAVFNLLCMLLLFTIVAGVPVINRFLSWRVFVWLGQRSYSFYLWYYAIIVFYLGFFRELGGNYSIINSLSILTLLLVGSIFYHYIEKGQLKVWFGTDFQVDKVTHEMSQVIEDRNYKAPQAIKFLLYIIGIAIFLRGLQLSADHKRPAQHVLEYQLFQTQVNTSGTPYPGIAPIQKVQALIADLDSSFSTNLTREKVDNQASDIIQNTAKVTADSQAIQTMVSENQETLDFVAEEFPIVFVENSPQEILYATEVPVTFFGDSLILLSGYGALELFWEGNTFGQKSLNIWNAIPIFEEMILNGEMQANIVINLGTNGGLDHAAMDELVALAGSEYQLFFVNTNSRVAHLESVNQIIADTAETYANVHVIDWYAYSQGHPEWYAPDEIHHNGEGAQRFMSLVARRLFEVTSQGEND